MTKKSPTISQSDSDLIVLTGVRCVRTSAAHDDGDTCQQLPENEHGMVSLTGARNVRMYENGVAMYSGERD